MTSSVPVVSVGSYEEALMAAKDVEGIFKDIGVVVIRGHNFSDEEHTSLCLVLGDSLGWNMNSNAETRYKSGTYKGGHSDLEDDRAYTIKADEYLLDWHIEQVFYVSPILAGLWNMHKFTAPSGSGRTNFMDSCKLYETFTPEEQNFLDKSVMYWKKQSDDGSGPYYTKAVASHPISGKPTLRIETDRGCEVPPELYLLDKKEPSEQEKQKFKDLVSSLKTRLLEDRDLLIQQDWQEGDLLIVDLFRMYHSVFGGFDRGQREFTGIGVRPEIFDQSKYDSLETLWKN